MLAALLPMGHVGADAVPSVDCALFSEKIQTEPMHPFIALENNMYGNT